MKSVTCRSGRSNIRRNIRSLRVEGLLLSNIICKRLIGNHQKPLKQNVMQTGKWKHWNVLLIRHRSRVNIGIHVVHIETCFDAVLQHKAVPVFVCL